MAIIFSDDFNRANSTSVGNGWMAGSGGNWKVDNNNLCMDTFWFAATVATSEAIHAPIADCYAEVEYVSNAGGDADCGVILRNQVHLIANNDMAYCYFADSWVSGSTRVFEVYRKSIGNDTLVGSVSLPSTALPSGTTIGCEVTGTNPVSFRLFKDGAQVGTTITDSSVDRYSGGGGVGVICYNDSARFDNFVLDDLSTSAAELIVAAAAHAHAADAPTFPGGIVSPVIEAGDCTDSGSNVTTPATPWAVSTPAAGAGDLLVFVVAWDDSVTVTTVTPAAGQNGETVQAVAGPVASAGTEIRTQAWFVVTSGAWSAGSHDFTPNATEQWTATVIRVPAGEFDPNDPLGAVATRASAGTAETLVRLPVITSNADDLGGRLVFAGAVDADPLLTLSAGYTSVANVDRGNVALGVAVRDATVENSESIAEATWSISSDSWASLAFVIRPKQPEFATTADDATHAHAADSPALTQAGTLAVAEADHAHAADAVELVPAGSQVTFRSVSTADYLTNRVDSLTIAAPPGVQDGDRLTLVFCIGANLGGSDPETPTFPAGWTQYGTRLRMPQSSFALNVYYLEKLASSEPADYTITWDAGGANRSAGALVCAASGAHQTTLPDFGTNQGTSGPLASFAGFTGLPAGSLVQFVTVNWNYGASDPPSGFTERYDSVENILDLSTREYPDGGDTGALSHDSSSTSADPWAVLAFAIPPAAAGAGGATLTAQEAAHDHAADSPTLAQGYVLAAAEAAHAHASDAPELTQANTLGVAAATHGHTADVLALVQGYVLALASADHAHAADAVTLSEAAALAVAEALHGHAVDSVALTQAHALAVQEAAHGHTAAAVTLSQAVALAVAEAAHGHFAASVELSQALSLVVDEVTHGLTADEVALAQAHVLTIAAALHAHLADGVTLSQGLSLAIADATHALSSDAPTLTQAHVLEVAQAVHTVLSTQPELVQNLALLVASTLHAHAVDSVGLSTADTLGVSGATHAHVADSFELVQAHVLLVDEASHDHSVELVTLSAGFSLAVADALHAHVGDSVDLTQGHVLAVASTLHLQEVGAVELTEAAVLLVSDALHAHFADVLGLQKPGQTARHVFVVQAGGRTYVVAPRGRELVVAPRGRSYTIQ